MTWLPISAARPGVTYRLLVNDREADGMYVLIGGEWHHASGRKLCCKPTMCREVGDD